MNHASAKIDELAQRLARMTGEDLETALERAIEERIARVTAPSREKAQAALRTFFDRLSALPSLDARTADEIIGYGADGLPSR